MIAGYACKKSGRWFEQKPEECSVCGGTRCLTEIEEIEKTDGPKGTALVHQSGRITYLVDDTATSCKHTEIERNNAYAEKMGWPVRWRKQKVGAVTVGAAVYKTKQDFDSYMGARGYAHYSGRGEDSKDFALERAHRTQHDLLRARERR